MKKLFATTLAVVSLLVLAGAEPALAVENFDANVSAYFGTCLSTKVSGNFQLQSRATGSTSWVSQGSSKAWDDRMTEDGTCPKYAVGAIWAYPQAGTYTLRIYNLANHKTYKTWSVRFLGASVPTVQTVKMPKIVGGIDGQVPWWLTTHGYKFRVMTYPHNIGFAPVISCMMSKRNLVLRQYPAAGTIVENSTNTQVEMWVNCNGG